MNVAESKGLKKGNRVYWRGDATDSGIITEMSWDAVMIVWDNGQVAIFVVPITARDFLRDAIMLLVTAALVVGLLRIYFQR